MSQSLAVRPWQVWLVDFGVPVGAEPSGVRPAVIIGSDDHCRFPIDMALIVPLTTRDRGLSHHVAITSVESGLSRPSWARTDDIKAVSTARFRRTSPLGTLVQAERDEVARWIQRMIASPGVAGEGAGGVSARALSGAGS